MAISNTRAVGMLEWATEFSHQALVDQAASTPWGAIGLCGDHDQIEQLRRDGTLAGVMTFADHWDAYDAVVDSTHQSSDPDRFGSIKQAIDTNAVAIFVNSAVEPAAFTIASGDKVQRIIGKDADTTTVPVDITCNKADVTFEQLKFDNTNLTINGNGCRVKDCLFTGTAVLTIDENDCLVEDNRFDTCSVIPLVVVEGANRIERNLFRSITAANAISLDSDGSDLGGLIISDNYFPLSTTLTDYVLQSQGTTGNDEIISAIISGNVFGNAPAGHIDIFGHANLITNNSFTLSATLPTSDRAIQLNSLAGTAVDTLVAGNSFFTLAVSNRIIEYTGADGDAEGLVFANNSVSNAAGHILCSQDMQIAHNKIAASVTVNFQSKTGIVCMGGDMTSATLSNANADLVLRGVKGQDDRGDIVHGTGSIRLNDNIELDFGTGGDVELSYDGTNFILNPAVVGSGTLKYRGSTLDLDADSRAILFGTGLDAGISYDGSDLILAPALVGTGDVKITGGSLHVVDNEATVYGTGEDATITYDGSNLLLQPAVVGTGDVQIAGGSLNIITDNESITMGSGEDATLLYDGTDLQVNARAVGTGDMVVKGDILPQADSTYDLGSTGVRYAEAYTDALDVTNNIVVGGTVDGVDIAARDHAAAHTAVSHSDQGATGAELETLTDGSDADSLHVHTNTVAEHSDTSATGAELNTLTSAGDASALHGHGNYTDEVFLQPVMHVNAAQSNTGDIAFVLIDDTQKMHFTWMLPDTWVSTTSVELIMYPDATETITVDWSVSSLAAGETTGDNQTISANQTKAVTIAQITEWDVTSLVPTGAAGDVLLVRLDSDTPSIRVVGLKIVFVRSQAQ